jgi:MGT family glycosyltransferase
MSTALVLNMPAHGHINPTLPLIAELVKRGEKVIYYGLEPFRASIEETGAMYRPYGKDFPLDPDHDANRLVGPFSTIEALLETSQWILDHKLQEIRDVQADYVIHDAFCLWGSYVARVLDRPAIASISTMVLNEKIASGGKIDGFMLQIMSLFARQRITRSRAIASQLSERYKLRAPSNLFELFQSHGALNIVYTSRAFQPFAELFDERHYKFVGPSILPRLQAPTFPFDKLDGRPLIYISLGTAYNKQPAFFQKCIKAFAEGPWQIVMAIGQHISLDSLGNLPSNFIVQSFVPQLDVLQHADLFITHGGMNSVNEALYYNVPLVVVPQIAEQNWNAKRVAELGTGKVLSARQITAQKLRRSVEKILAQPAYAQAAARIGESLRDAGGYVKAADEVQALIS